MVISKYFELEKCSDHASHQNTKIRFTTIVFPIFLNFSKKVKQKMQSLNIVSKEEKQHHTSNAQKRVFLLTYTTYIMVYFLRKPWSTCKLAIGKDLDLDLKSLGAVDTGFLVAYALGQIFLSPLGDMYGPRYMISAVLMGSGLLCVVLSQAYDFNVIALAWTANGAFQALAFPLMMKALTPWFPSHIRGKVFGLWTTSQGIGGVLAVSFGGYVADSYLTWRGAFSVRTTTVRHLSQNH